MFLIARAFLYFEIRFEENRKMLDAAKIVVLLTEIFLGVMILSVTIFMVAEEDLRN